MFAVGIVVGFRWTWKMLVESRKSSSLSVLLDGEGLP